MKKAKFHYLKLYIKSTKKDWVAYVVITDKETGNEKTISLEKALKLHEAGELFNKKYGNNFAVDCSDFKEAIRFVLALNDGARIQAKGPSIYVAKRNRQTIEVSTSSLRQFFPELL